MDSTGFAPGAANGLAAPGPRTVYILVLNWNNWRDTNECLASLQNLTYDDWRVLVLDNGSTDDSVRRIRQRFPETEVTELAGNLGFAKGNNAGIRAALDRGAGYVWLLNNDTKVDAQALSAMVDVAESDLEIGAVGSTIYSMAEPARLQAWGGGRINFWLGRSTHFVNAVQDDKIHFLTGASLLLRREAVESLGLLDDGFFMYWEDADYCFRLRRSGRRLAVAAKSKIWHREQGSVGKKSALLITYFNRSAVRFFRRHARFPLVPVCTGIAGRLVKFALAGDWRRIRAVLGADIQGPDVAVQRRRGSAV